MRGLLNRALTNQDYFDFGYFDATTSQAIPSGVWTTVKFDAMFNGNTDITLNTSTGVFTFPATIGGYWDVAFYVAWENTAAGLGTHRRLARYMADTVPSTFPFQVVQANEAPFISGMGDLSKPTYQFGYVQAGIDMTDASQHYIQVYQNSGSTINIVKSGIDAPLFMVARRGDWTPP